MLCFRCCSASATPTTTPPSLPMSSAPANRSPTTSPRGTPTKDQLHRLYLAKLEVPTPEKIASISQLQEEKERAIDERYRPGNDVTEAEDNSEKARSDPAAGTTQVRRERAKEKCMNKSDM